jgi:hypothetical protein
MNAGVPAANGEHARRAALPRTRPLARLVSMHGLVTRAGGIRTLWIGRTDR